MREGRAEPMPHDVRAHLDGCESCRLSMIDADETRGWFDDDAFELSENAAAAMRFTLEAAAREPRAVEPPARSRGVWVAGAVLAAAAAVALVLRAPAGIVPRDKDALVPLARVTASPGVADMESKAPHESYRLVDGSAVFDVRPLGEAESFVVRVGTESVHVRGTSYRVEAEDGRLMAVHVSEGVVEVVLEDVPNPVLHAGEAWIRGEDADADADSDTAEAEAEPVSAVRPPRVRAPTFDALFREAWSLHRAQRSAAAAAAFDRLLDHPDVGAREADVLFWSAQSHLARGNEARARERLERLVARHPDALRAADARRQLGEL